MTAAFLTFALLVSITFAVKKMKLEDGPASGFTCDPSVKSFSGYFSVSDNFSKNYVYWFVESRATPSSDSLVIWLTEGPGSSSQLSLLTENGPCKVSDDGLSTVSNSFSSNTNANIMWVGHPADVGLSYRAIVDHNETEIGEDMYLLLQEFLKAHPEYQKNELYVFGESDGGHYAPAVFNRIYRGNKNGDGVYVNLKGVGVGPLMAMNNTYVIKTVSEVQYSTCTLMRATCQESVDVCETAYTYCNWFFVVSNAIYKAANARFGNVLPKWLVHLSNYVLRMLP
jgi:carboxypeptidase C (cathepsin A)